MSAPPFDVVGLGEAMVVLRPLERALEDADACSVSVAGAELNACAAVASLGGTAAFFTRVGDDPFGRRVLSRARSLGVHAICEVDPRQPTGVFFADRSMGAERSVYYYRGGSAAAQLDLADGVRAGRVPARVALLSGLTAALGDGGPARAVEAFAKAAHAAGTALVVDANLRPALGLERSLATLHAMLPLVSVLVLGQDEGLHLFGSDDPALIIAAGLSAGADEVVVKGGEHGAWCLDDSAKLHHTAAVETEVVDTVGAGDAFTGAYAWARARSFGSVGAVMIATRVAARIVAVAGDTEGLPGIDDRAAVLAGIGPSDA